MLHQNIICRRLSVCLSDCELHSHYSDIYNENVLWVLVITDILFINLFSYSSFAAKNEIVTNAPLSSSGVLIVMLMLVVVCLVTLIEVVVGSGDEEMVKVCVVESLQ